MADDSDDFYDAEEDFSSSLFQAFPKQLQISGDESQKIAPPQIVVTDSADPPPAANHVRQQSINKIGLELQQQNQQKANEQQTAQNPMLLPVDKVLVKDLDSGQVFDADALHEEYKRTSRIGNNPLSDLINQRSGISQNELNTDESGDEVVGSSDVNNSKKGLKFAKSKIFFNNMKKKVSNKFKNDSEESGVDSDYGSTSKYIKVKSKHVKKKQFNRLVLLQELVKGSSSKMKNSYSFTRFQGEDKSASNEAVHDQRSPPCKGPIWAMKFNREGKYLATGGQDAYLRVWSLSINGEENGEEQLKSGNEGDHKATDIFKKEPYRCYQGHEADILDISWSKNDFILSSSMDKTVRVWHVSRTECLCVFQHSDYVTSISFHPKDDRFFLSGCLDCRLRLWNIPEKKVLFWNELPEVHSLITSVGFSHDGKTAIAGSYLGACVFYEVEGLKYYTQVHAKSTRGKNSRGEKITGIEYVPNQPIGEEKVMITSNDSRIRIYNMRDMSLFCKYKGYTNYSSQIKATFSDDGRYIISGSEDNYAYIWETFVESQDSQLADIQSENASTKSPKVMRRDNSKILDNLPGFKQNRRDRNNRYEAFAAHDSIVTCAVFVPSKIVQKLQQAGLTSSHFQEENQANHLQIHRKSVSSTQAPLTGSEFRRREPRPSDGRLIITSDYNGCIRVFENEIPSLHHQNQNTIQSGASLRSSKLGKNMIDPKSLGSLVSNSSQESSSQ